MLQSDVECKQAEYKCKKIIKHHMRNHVTSYAGDFPRV